MGFKINKKNALSKLDKSKIGSIDKDIKPLVDLINSKKNYYTTSSCSGRICLTIKSKDFKKNKTEWLLQKHEKVKLQELNGKLQFYSNPENLEKYKESSIWFEQEPFILHAACKSIEDAKLLLNKVRQIGLKRSGIISLKKNVIEIIGTEEITVIIGKDLKIKANNDFLELLLKQANYNFNKNQDKINKLVQILN